MDSKNSQRVNTPKARIGNPRQREQILGCNPSYADTIKFKKWKNQF